MLTLPQIKKITSDICEAFGVSSSDASALVQYYKDDDATLSRITAGDFSGIPSAAHALNINITAANQDIKKDHAELASSMSDESILYALKRGKNFAAAVSSSDSPAGDDVELPEILVQNIEDTIVNYCNKYNIDDLRKMSASVWRGACMAVGFMLKKSGALRDRQKEKITGGKRFNAPLIAALVPLWAFLCSLYDKPPLASDFIAFTGVSSAWFYNCNGGGDLSSACVGIYKKVLQLQESGLSSSLVDGRRNPTGTIFFLKNWHGWRDQREIVHTDGGSGSAPTSYPTFLLEGSSDGDEGGVQS